MRNPQKIILFVLINNKSKPLLETIKSRCLEIKISLKDNVRKATILSLIKYFDQDIFLNEDLVSTTPGNFIKFDYIFRKNKIEINDDFLKNFLILLNLYKKEKIFFIRVFNIFCRLLHAI